MIVVWEGNTARFGGITASAFAGICALAYLYDYHFNRASKFYIPVPSIYDSRLSFGYDFSTFVLKAPRLLSLQYDNPYGFFMDLFLIFCGRTHIDMTPTAFVLI